MDELQFHFEGALADRNRMDFYEAARFQYAAARLSVKLDQFRKSGRFSKRITSESRTNIDLFPFERGSFNLRIAASADEGDVPKIDVPLTALWTYVIERTFHPVETSAALDLIDDNALRSEFFDIINDNIFDASNAIDILKSAMETDRGLTARENELLGRLLSETERRAYLASHRDILSAITPSQDAALVTMAAPLLSELAIPLRRSAKLVTISTIDALGQRPILTADYRTASALEAIKIDKHVSSIDVDIVQYNKETGWGKFRNEYWTGIPSFSVPADRKDDLRFDLLSAMLANRVSVDAYIVRSLSDEPLRLILVDVRIIDESDR